MADWIPDPDGDFDTWVANFVTVVTAAPANYGLTAAQVAPLAGLLAAWVAALADQDAKQKVAEAATDAKDTARLALEALVRELIGIFQQIKAVTDAAKLAAGAPVHDTIKTPVPPPTTAPVGRVEIKNRLEHIMHFVDSATPTSKAKPAGVRGCQIWMKIGGTAPASESEMQFVISDPKTPHKIEFQAADAGKTVYYWLRWENTKGIPGPWSAVVTATITG